MNVHLNADWRDKRKYVRQNYKIRKYQNSQYFHEILSFIECHSFYDILKINNIRNHIKANKIDWSPYLI